MKFKKPNFWDLKKPNLISYLLLPITLIVLLNNFILKFKSNKNKQSIKTICVGNIYIGGTGKTPTVIKIFQILKDLKFDVLTAKKFYGSQYDENKILETKTNFLTGKNRKIIIDLAIQDKKDIVIFDDGLQDKNIKYDLQIVCFDNESFIGNGFLIPAGPLREKLSSLKKYDCVFIKNVSEEILDEKINLIKKQNQNIQIFETYLEVINLKKFDLTKKYLIFSGLGNPSNFKKTLEKNNFKIIDEMIFPDHHEYTRKEIKKILKKAKESNASIITTQKDFVKISHFQFEEIRFLETELKIKNEETFLEFLKKEMYEKH